MNTKCSKYKMHNFKRLGNGRNFCICFTWIFGMVSALSVALLCTSIGAGVGLFYSLKFKFEYHLLTSSVRCNFHSEWILCLLEHNIGCCFSFLIAFLFLAFASANICDCIGYLLLLFALWFLPRVCVCVYLYTMLGVCLCLLKWRCYLWDARSAHRQYRKRVVSRAQFMTFGQAQNAK